MPFQPLTQEPEIQRRWLESGAFRAKRAGELLPGSKTFYMLVMLPYPSGRIHMGHVRNYTLGDVTARFRRMKGYEVMHPLGWDSFGLPAENAAIKHGIHPAIWTRKNIEEMKGQIQKMGISYDWDREIASFQDDYYRWNQWLFLQMWEQGDVFRAMRTVNWCEALGTVLANEQVVDGKDERTGHPVTQKPLEQYFFKTTKYADELLDCLDGLDWPDNVKTMQRHWIGKSEGARLAFDLEVSGQIEVFTTRLDTLFGVTFMALSTEHPVIEKAAEVDAALKAFCDQVAAVSREERLTSDVKLGHRTALSVIHPFTGEKVPVFAANYVLMDYGTGAVMGVPAHDERDHEFAEKYGLPIPKVIESESEWDLGTLVNSGEFTGLKSEEAVAAMIAKLGTRAEKTTTYKLKDWGLSRQRYWGTPIPTVHCPDCGVVPEKAENLPVRLPEDVAFTGHGPSPLTTSRSFLDCACPACGKPARRETDTMDTFVDSSWYWLRYLDPKNTELPFAKAESDAWMPVDLYVGGIEHATMHLIYARFFYKVLRDLGLASGPEPFQKLICQGMVLKDGSKMSKSKGNIVDPDEVISRYGADALRLFMIFAAPIEKEIDWTGFEGIEGASRFLKRVTRMVEDHAVAADPLPAKDALSAEEKALLLKLNQTIARLTDDLERRYQFNTVVSGLMELSNALGDLPAAAPHRGAVMQHALDAFVRMMSPVAPHLAEQLWGQLGKVGLCMQAAWPEADAQYLEADEVLVVVQVNGKVRGRITVPAGATEEQRRAAALACAEAQSHLAGKEIVKVVLPPGGKLVSIVVKG
ncbi:leucine--tRNA ligase [Geothrix sp.]|jgi:leucyl-tRNA synthetase|uniref:leucine--tRNA ligase n=1 Tax=Geothrix sp. TaxID=1962974 RepID=UPI0025BBB01D|nr:leucine--tRNA ligase [Geothrix sp.]